MGFLGIQGLFDLSPRCVLDSAASHRIALKVCPLRTLQSSIEALIANNGDIEYVTAGGTVHSRRMNTKPWPRW